MPKASTLATSSPATVSALKSVLGVDTLTLFMGHFEMTAPTDFDWSDAPPIYQVGSDYLTTFDIDAQRPDTSVTYYVDPVSGSDSNDGLTTATPRAKLSTTVTLANTGGVAARFLCKPGNYYGDQGWGGIVPTIDFILEPWASDPADPANRIIMSRPAKLEGFFLDSGALYRNGGFFTTDPFGVFDTTSFLDGFPRKYELAADKATCLATPATYWRDTAASRLYVHTFDSRALPSTGDTGIIVSTTGGGNNLKFAATVSVTAWIQNVVCFDGGNSIDITAGATGIDVNVYLKDCVGFGSVFGNSMYFTTLQANSNINVYLKRCGAGYSVADGFNYRSEATGASVFYFEDECFTARNGYNTSTANNSSTAHGTAVGISLNGDYSGSQDRCINDINSTRRWMLGCDIGASYGTGASAVTVQAGSASGSHTTQIWLDGCTVEESTTAGLYAEATCFVRYRNTDVAGLTTGGTGTIEAY